MPTWQDVWSYAHGRWAWVAGIVGGGLLINSVIKVGKEHWQSHLKHVDTRIIDYLEEHATTAPSEGSKSRSVPDICKATKLSEKSVRESLHRLRRDQKVREHDESWQLK
jgi:hypothetical protein